MTFVKFVDTLYNTCSFGINCIEEFVREILMAMSGKKAKNRLDEISTSTLKNYYYKGLSKPIAKTIVSDIDETDFRGMLSSASYQTKENLVKAFELDSIESVENTLTDMLSEIIRKVSGKEITANSKENVSTKTSQDVFDVYLKNSESFYNDLKTLINPDSPQPFYKYYVCNRMQYRCHPNEGDDILSDATIDKISEITHFAIISGTGGIGKSMMMRHLFLDAIKKYPDTKRLPIFIPLRNFNTTTNTLLDFIYTCVADFDNDTIRGDIVDKLESGQCVLLFDGFDEIAARSRDLFVNSLNNFIKIYKDNIYIVSSRPTNNYINFYRFSVFNILGMNKQQAIELVLKLDYHNKESKEKFIKDLKENLYRTHKEFVENPLLLTIMLMTYSDIGNIPQKRYRFYEEAFTTMARRHDATKGSFVRPMNTNLEPEDFIKYFASFCALTYQKGMITFTEAQFISIMDKVIQKKTRCNNLKITARDFLSDLINNLCLMYKDGTEIHFIHRSFQEYFCAVFFSSEVTEKPKDICNFFNAKNTKDGDLAFDMLYEMVPDKIEKYILLPYLDKKFDYQNDDTDILDDDFDYEEGYLTFIGDMYGTIYSHTGTTGINNYDNKPAENIFRFICRLLNCDFNVELTNYKWTGFDDYKSEWTFVQVGDYEENGDSYEHGMLMDVHSDEFENIGQYILAANEITEPEIEGVSWKIDIFDLQDYIDDDLIDTLLDPRFPLKKQYDRAYQYWKMLKLRYSDNDDEDWLESLI